MSDTQENVMISLNLAGGIAREMKGGGGRKPVPAGVYAVTVRETTIHQKEDRQSVKFVCEVTDGENAGGSIWIYAGLDTEKPGNKNQWRTVFASLGLEAGDQVEMNIADFVGTNGYARLAPPRDGGEQLDKYFITPGDYAKLVAATGSQAAPVNMTVTTVPQQRVAVPKVAAAPAAPKAPTAAPGKVPVPKLTAPNLSAFLQK